MSNIEVGSNRLGAPELARWLEALNATPDERLEALRIAAMTDPPTSPPVVRRSARPKSSARAA